MKNKTMCQEQHREFRRRAKINKIRPVAYSWLGLEREVQGITNSFERRNSNTPKKRMCEPVPSDGTSNVKEQVPHFPPS